MHMNEKGKVCTKTKRCSDVIGYMTYENYKFKIAPHTPSLGCMGRNVSETMSFLACTLLAAYPFGTSISSEAITVYFL